MKSPARVPRFQVPVGLIAPGGANVLTGAGGLIGADGGFCAEAEPIVDAVATAITNANLNIIRSWIPRCPNRSTRACAAAVAKAFTCGRVMSILLKKRVQKQVNHLSVMLRESGSSSDRRVIGCAPVEKQVVLD